MTQEDKLLLLKYLCESSLYGIICQFIWTDSDETTDGESIIAKEDDNIRCIDIHSKEIQSYYYGEWVDLEHCKPYLRPMSSMTEEEFKELTIVTELQYDQLELKDWDDGVVHDMTYPVYTPYYVMEDCLSYLRSIHVDYLGLIEKNLALEAKEGMYNIKEK